MSLFTVHHLDQSRSQRLLWLLEELQLDYKIEHYARNAAGRAPKALRAVHPLGKSPVVTHGERVIAESGALMEYIIDTFGEGRMRPPTGTDDFQRYRFYMHFAEGTMMAPLLVKLLTGRVRASIPLLGKLIAGKIDATFTDPENRRHLEFVEAELEGRQWLAGDLSGADFMMSFPLQAAVRRAGIRGGFANLRAYLARIESRPAYERGIERGGPYSLLD